VASLTFPEVQPSRQPWLHAGAEVFVYVEACVASSASVSYQHCYCIVKLKHIGTTGSKPCSSVSGSLELSTVIAQVVTDV